MYIKAVLFILLVLSIALSGGNSAAITINSNQGRSLHQLYVKFTPPYGQHFLPNDNFTYVTGLDETFHISRNTLFKVTYQGCVVNNDGSDLRLYIQIMVNGYLIIANKVLPNTAERVNYGLGHTILIVDTKNGFYQVDTTVGILMPVTRIAYVYLAPGIYSFNVGARVEKGRGRVYDSTVTYELMQSENADDASLGDFPLVTTISKPRV